MKVQTHHFTADLLKRLCKTCKSVVVMYSKEPSACWLASHPPLLHGRWKASRAFEKEPVNSEEWLAAAFISFMLLSKDSVVEWGSPPGAPPRFNIFCLWATSRPQKTDHGSAGHSPLYELLPLRPNWKIGIRKHTVMFYFAACMSLYQRIHWTLHCSPAETAALLELHLF